MGKLEGPRHLIFGNWRGGLDYDKKLRMKLKIQAASPALIFAADQSGFWFRAVGRLRTGARDLASL